MLFDDMLVDAHRADLDRDLDRIEYARRCEAIANGGQPRTSFGNWFTRLFGGQKPETRVEVLEPVAIRIRSNN